MSDNYFAQLNAIDVSAKAENKNGLTYLSWAWAWGELKKIHPDATYTIYDNAEGWNYHTDGRTCWVKTGVTVNGIEHIEELPVMDYRNRAIPLENVTSFEVNKSIQRSLTKAVARHGLGLYIYAGEDLPEDAQKETKRESPVVNCADCGKPIVDDRKRNGELWPRGEIAAYSRMRYDRPLCKECMKVAEKAAKDNGT